MSDGLPTLASLEALGPRRAAALWLERMLSDDTDEDATLFQHWLGASDANRSAWKRAIDLWDSFDGAGDNDELSRMRNEALSFRARRRVPRWAPYAVAASLALVASSTLFLDRDRFVSTPAGQGVAVAAKTNLRQFGPVDYATAVGQSRTVTLTDGSRVTLDTDSAIDVAYSGGLRLVRLVRGQAFFDVVHNAAHPFRVAAGGRIVSVLGTRFNVRTTQAETRIVLAQGAIGVTSGDDPSHPQGRLERLRSGQQLIATAGGADRIVDADIEQGLAWRRGFVQFDRDTLQDAVAELNRYTRTQLVIDDPQVAQMRVSGAFRTGDTQGFAQTLTELYPLQVVPAAGGKLEIVARQ